MKYIDEVRCRRTKRHIDADAIQEEYEHIEHNPERPGNIGRDEARKQYRHRCKDTCADEGCTKAVFGHPNALALRTVADHYPVRESAGKRGPDDVADTHGEKEQANEGDVLDVVPLCESVCERKQHSEIREEGCGAPKTL
jgi:hypothetical protein